MQPFRYRLELPGAGQILSAEAELDVNLRGCEIRLKHFELAGPGEGRLSIRAIKARGRIVNSESSGTRSLSG